MYKYDDKNTALNTDAWDHHTFNAIVEKAENFRKNVTDFAKKSNERYGLMGDVFSSLYKQTPMLKSEMLKLMENVKAQDATISEEDLLTQIMKEHQIASIEREEPVSPNEAVMQKVLDNEEYQKMHNHSVGDKLHTAVSTMALGEEIQKWFSEQEQQNEDFKNAQNEQKQAESDLKKANDAIEKRENDGKSPTKGQLEKQQAAQEKFEQASKALAQQISQSMSNEKMGEMIQKSNEQAKQAKENTENLLGGAGEGDAELKKLPIDAQVAMADLLRNNENVARIAEMAGRFKEIARKKQKNKYEETIERNGITMGKDIERLLPQELAQYHNQGTRLEFLRRFAEGETMMYSPKGKETLGKGAIVLVLDESGSMNNLNAESKGFTIALAMIAKKQKRDFVVIPFANNIGEPIVCEKGDVTTQDIISLATKFLSGGTQYMPALRKAQEFIEQQTRFKNGDIIFVTDGSPTDTGAIEKDLPKFLQFKKEREVNVFSLLIGNGVNATHVERFADKVFTGNSFFDKDATELMAL